MSIQDDCTGFPLAAGSVHGVRTFRVDPLGRLTGVSYKAVWTPGENVATCKRDPLTTMMQQYQDALDEALRGRYKKLPKSTPTAGPCKGDDPECTCGFYAYHDGSTYFGGDVTGVIEGYGRTTIGTKGFRSQKARIVALCIPDERTPGRDERRARTLTAVAVGAWLAFLLTYMSLPPLGPWWWLGLGAAASSGGAMGYAATTWRRHRRQRLDRCAAPWADKVRRNYPDVAYFADRAAMLAAYPPDPQLEPTPETDPEFWSRSAR